MKNFIFFSGTTNNSELGGPRPSWIDKILLYHLCFVCFFTFLAIYQGKFGFGKFQQKLGLRSDLPTPCWAKCPTFSENGFWWPPWDKDEKHPQQATLPLNFVTPCENWWHFWQLRTTVLTFIVTIQSGKTTNSICNSCIVCTLFIFMIYILSL